MSHPLRVRILAMLDERKASPNQLADWLGARLGTVAYHVRTLEQLGLIEVVDETRVRGAVEPLPGLRAAQSHGRGLDSGTADCGVRSARRRICAPRRAVSEAHRAWCATPSHSATLHAGPRLASGQSAAKRSWNVQSMQARFRRRLGHGDALLRDDGARRGYDDRVEPQPSRRLEVCERRVVTELGRASGRQSSPCLRDGDHTRRLGDRSGAETDGSPVAVPPFGCQLGVEFWRPDTA
jgi:hypothetical protein